MKIKTTEFRVEKLNLDSRKILLRVLEAEFQLHIKVITHNITATFLSCIIRTNTIVNFK